MTISSSASWPELLRRASSASSHLHSAIFCRPNRPRPIDTWRTSAQTPPRRTWICGSEPERRRWRDRSATPRGRHQGSSSSPAHLIIPDDGQQAAMQDTELLAKRPSNNEQRFDQRRQVGQVLDELSDAGLEPHRPNHPDLETEVAQSTAQVVIDGNRLRLQQLAMGQQHPKFLTTQRLHMHRAVKPNPHHLGDAARIVAVSLVNLRLQRRSHVPRLDTDYRQAHFGKRAEQPLRQRSSFQSSSLEAVGGVLQHRQQRCRLARHLHFTNDLARVIHNADARVLDRNVQSSKMLHAALLLLMLEAAQRGPRFTISLKRSTQILQLSTSCRPITPSIGGKADIA